MESELACSLRNHVALETKYCLARLGSSAPAQAHGQFDSNVLIEASSRDFRIAIG